MKNTNELQHNLIKIQTILDSLDQSLRVRNIFISNQLLMELYSNVAKDICICLYHSDLDEPLNHDIEEESDQEKEIHITHVITEILRNQFFRKIDFPVTKYDCLLDVCDNLIKESRRRQENRFKRTAYQEIGVVKNKVWFE